MRTNISFNYHPEMQVHTGQTSWCIIVKVYIDCKNLKVFKGNPIISCELFFFFF